MSWSARQFVGWIAGIFRRDGGKPEDAEEIDNSPMYRELDGARQSLNPVFGEWSDRFNFPPVPYRDGGQKLRAFKEQIRAQLKNKFLYCGEVQVSIHLLLDVQTVLETSESADVDNYAKAILDALRGPDGIMLDDSQVQSLDIGWIDNHETYFTVRVRSSPDDFILKPATFYEMPDGLWYPQSRVIWEDGVASELSDLQHFVGLWITEIISKAQKEARHAFRAAGTGRLAAYRLGRYMASSARGFHKSRVTEAGFELHDWHDWQRAFETWRSEHGDEVAPFEKLLSEVRENYGRMAAALSPARERVKRGPNR